MNQYDSQKTKELKKFVNNIISNKKHLTGGDFGHTYSLIKAGADPDF
ncbi:MAG: hypothetical protein IBX55_00750 [Methyloprofundus sp.]|nr:hypothetical protein [Methyloprofundus sp.]